MSTGFFSWLTWVDLFTFRSEPSVPHVAHWEAIQALRRRGWFFVVVLVFPEVLLTSIISLIRPYWIIIGLFLFLFFLFLLLVVAVVVFFLFLSKKNLGRDSLEGFVTTKIWESPMVSKHSEVTWLFHFGSLVKSACWATSNLGNL